MLCIQSFLSALLKRMMRSWASNLFNSDYLNNPSTTVVWHTGECTILIRFFCYFAIKTYRRKSPWLHCC
ncbi:unnamed protein product [Leptidea sinapis]|uniref:Uncharacterized protein n=1 Tax=Leptidea sinapis TaxID=189913 RepID=A0A5E4PLS2_9NEOP|nr:unnamed protein product [Leptidea sinapis]